MFQAPFKMMRFANWSKKFRRQKLAGFLLNKALKYEKLAAKHGIIKIIYKEKQPRPNINKIPKNIEQQHITKVKQRKKQRGGVFKGKTGKEKRSRVAVYSRKKQTGKKQGGGFFGLAPLAAQFGISKNKTKRG